MAPPSLPTRDTVFLGVVAQLQGVFRSEISSVRAYAYVNNKLGPVKSKASEYLRQHSCSSFSLCTQHPAIPPGYRQSSSGGPFSSSPVTASTSQPITASICFERMRGTEAKCIREASGAWSDIPISSVLRFGGQHLRRRPAAGVLDCWRGTCSLTFYVARLCASSRGEWVARMGRSGRGRRRR